MVGNDLDHHIEEKQLFLILAWKIRTHQNDVQNRETMKEAQLVERVAVEFKKDIELSQDKTEVLTGERIHKWQ